MTNYAFNITFTRPDENDANVYKIGYNSYGTGIDTVEAAEKNARESFAHLTIISVELFAVTDEDGKAVSL